MKRKKKLNVLEAKCPACGGTGHEPVAQPSPGRRIYAPKCKVCGGKGRTKEAAD
jgi:DnaJ-class molecular chaperone